MEGGRERERERESERERERENIEKFYLTPNERATTGKIEPPLRW